MNKNRQLFRFAMQRTIIAVVLTLVTLSFASCSSDEPQWADSEAHEKTEQLRSQYTPFIVGTWHIEHIDNKQRIFEQLTFNADGTLIGLRKWQTRQIVTIGGQEQYTDWENLSQPNGRFTGTWSLIWERNEKGMGENRLLLYGDYDETDVVTYLPYSTRALFDYADATTLRFAGLWQNSDGWTTYQRGEAAPSF